MAFESLLSSKSLEGVNKRMVLDGSVKDLAVVREAMGTALGRGHGTQRNAVAREGNGI